MSLTPSNMIALGTLAPGFQLPDTNANMQVKNLQQLAGSKATLVMFLCNHCPYVKHIKSALCQLAGDYMMPLVSLIAISSNDVKSHPQDGPIKMTEEGYPFPYLYDETQAVAKAYDAACTPDFFVFDQQLTCVYRGQFDDSRPGNGVAVSGKDLRHTLDAMIANQPISISQKPSIGCNIKWR